jgi:hypothetical protein
MTPAFERATQQIKELAQIADVVRGYVPNLRVSGPHLVGLCCLHGDKNTPSLEVTPSKGLFHCWGCGAAGDVFSWIQAAEGVSFPEARRILGARYGIRLDGLSTYSEIQAARRQRAYNKTIEAECLWFWRWLRAWLQRLRLLYQEALACSETWLERYGWMRRDVAASRLLAAMGTASPASLVGVYRRCRGAGWVVAARGADMAVRDGLTAWFGSGAVADERMATWGI